MRQGWLRCGVQTGGSLWPAPSFPLSWGPDPTAAFPTLGAPRPPRQKLPLPAPFLTPDSGPRQRLLNGNPQNPLPDAGCAAGARRLGVPGAWSYFYKMRQLAGEEEPGPGPLSGRGAGRDAEGDFERSEGAKAARAGGRGGASGAGPDRGAGSRGGAGRPPAVAGWRRRRRRQSGDCGDSEAAAPAATPGEARAPPAPPRRARERERPRGPREQTRALGAGSRERAGGREPGSGRSAGARPEAAAERAGAGGGRRARASGAAAAEAASRETKAHRRDAMPGRRGRGGRGV